jgi:ligand-binding sensor domain-containing protein/DNA-binding CsgD family transcriptional regulator
MSIFRKIGFSIVLLFLSVLAVANIKQMGSPLIKHYSRKQFHAGQQNWMIDHDSQGLLYFANNNGLLVFDGTRWDIHPLPNHTILRSIHVVGNRIYAGGYDELGYFQYSPFGKLVFISLIDSLPESARHPADIWKIYNLPIGIVFQSYHQLIIFDKKNQCQVLRAPSQFHFSFVLNAELYVQDMEAGMMRLSPERLVPLAGMEALSHSEVVSMIPGDSVTLVATVDHGIYLYDGITLKPWKNKASRFLQKNQVYTAIAVGSDLAFGTIQNGLLICDWRGNIKQHINLETGLQNNTILSLHVGPFGNLWLGTDNGIDMVEISSALSFMGPTMGLSAGYAMVRFHDTLYAGTNQGVFYLPWSEFRQPNNNKHFQIVRQTQGQVWSLQVIDHQLFCGHNKGFFVIRGNRAHNICRVPGGWKLFKMPDHPDLLFGGTYTGLVRFIKQKQGWEYAGKVSGFEESSRVIEIESDTTLWLAHGFKGIYHLTLSSDYDSVRTVNFYNQRDGFPTNTQLGVFRIQNQVVFTTPRGLYQFRRHGEPHFEKNNALNKLFAPDIPEMIHEGPNGSIWFFTDKQIGVLRHQEDGSFNKITVPFSGISGEFINGFQFVYPMDDQNVFIGMDKGFIHYDPSFEKNYNTPFYAFIGQLKFPDSKQSIQHLHLRTSPDTVISIPFANNHVYIQFSATDFENAKELVFSTRLEGFEPKWTEWSGKRSSEYTNLPEGEYTFHVKALNVYGTLSQEAAFRFVILPPWYRSAWAYVLYAVLFLALIIGLIYFFYKRLELVKRREKLEQERQHIQRENQILFEKLQAEKEVIRLKNEQLHKEMIAKDMELSNATFGIIQKNKLLIRLKNEIMKMMHKQTDGMVNAQFSNLLKRINREIDNKQQWKVFEAHFEAVHEDFLKRLKEQYPGLSPRELKLCAYLRLNISTKEIALLMNISPRGVEISRYRLRAKLGLKRKDSLVDFILKI